MKNDYMYMVIAKVLIIILNIFIGKQILAILVFYANCLYCNGRCPCMNWGYMGSKSTIVYMCACVSI